MSDYPLVFVWASGPPAGYPNPVRAALKGHRCRIVVTGRMGSALIEMADGRRVVTSRRAVRRAA